MEEKKKSNFLNRNKSEFKLYREHADLVFMFLPGFLLLIIFAYIPMYGLLMAFTDYKVLDGIAGSDWVGLKYFKRLFADPEFWRVFKNTLRFSIVKLISSFPAPIIFALLLNEVKNKLFKKVTQTLTYLPHFFSWVILGGILLQLFSTHGPVNTVLASLFNKPPTQFFAEGGAYFTIIIVSNIWQGFGWGAVVYLASLSGIDSTLYEAAWIDGAGRLKQTFYITLPCLVPTIVVVFILGLSNVLNAGFDQIFNTYNPAVYDMADIIDTYVLRKLQNMNYSLGTAVGLFKSVISLVLVVSSNFFIGKITDGEQGIW